jgi:RNA-directed DNA polymerase
VQFDFLGYTFRPRSSRRKTGRLFVNFAPAISDKARKAIGHTIRRWRLHLYNSKTLSELAAFVNPILRGWINYYGRFYRSRLVPVLKRVNDYLARWATRKYKRLRGHNRRAYRFIKAVAQRQPGLFAHWRLGLTP